jgi:hypothetical protein
MIYNKDALFFAVRNRRWLIMRQCIENGVDVNSRYVDQVSQDKYDDNDTPLIAAIKSQSLICYVRYLLKQGADVNAVNTNGFTALMYAVGRLHYLTQREIVELLLSYGAKPDMKNKYGSTAISIAHSSGLPALEMLLIGALNQQKAKAQQAVQAASLIKPASETSGKRLSTRQLNKIAKELLQSYRP